MSPSIVGGVSTGAASRNGGAGAAPSAAMAAGISVSHEKTPDSNTEQDKDSGIHCQYDKLTIGNSFLFY
jgi:hypothetical protein